MAGFEGVRRDVPGGYGLVVGPTGRGDPLRNGVLPREGLAAMLERLDVSTHGNSVTTKNVAALTVAAHLPPSARQGSRAQLLNQRRIDPGATGDREDPFAAQLRDEYGRIIARSGGIGIVDAVMRELLRAQGVA